MPSYVVTSPEGRRFKINAPEGATKEQALEYAKTQFAQPDVQPQEQQPQTQPRGPLRELGRQVGLTARYGAEGLAMIPATIANIPAAASNVLLGTEFPEQNQAVANLLSRVGLPKPENSTERVVGDIGRSLVGTGAFVKTGANLAANAVSPVTRAVGNLLTKSPKAQAVSTVTGAGAGALAKEEDAGPAGQMLATLAGGLAPSAIAQVPSLVKSLLRGGATTEEINAVMDAFQSVGATPTVGQATGSRLAQGAESLIEKAPGGGAPLTQKAIALQTAVGGKIDEMASRLAPAASGEKAGRAIRAGVKESVGIKRGVQSGLYNKLDAFIPLDKPSGASNFLKALNEIDAPIAGAESLSKTNILRNPKISELSRAARLDVDEFGNLPYQALKDIRTRIGQQMEDSLSSDVPNAQLKRLYGALSEDMGAAAKAAGPQAEKAFKRANNYTKGLHKRLEIVNDVVSKNGGPEKVFQAALSGTAEGATTFRAVMKSLPQDDKQLLVSTVLRRLGRATPGRQNDVGDVFSTETFLTNWNRLSPEAKSTMVGPMGANFKRDMDKIAKIASNLREGSRVYANPSGTAPMEQAFKTYGTLGVAGATGNLTGLGLALAGIGATRGAGKLMTSPAVVRWVATAPKNPTMFKAHIAKLTAIGAANPLYQDEIEELKNNLEEPNDSPE